MYESVGYFEIIKGLVLICCLVGSKGNISVPEGTLNCDLFLGFPFPLTVVHGDLSSVFLLYFDLLGGTWLPSVGKGLSLMSF